MKLYVEVFPFGVLKKKFTSPHLTVKVFKRRILDSCSVASRLGCWNRGTRVGVRQVQPRVLTWDDFLREYHDKYALTVYKRENVRSSLS